VDAREPSTSELADPVLRAAVERLVAEFKPLRIILLGSRARGEGADRPLSLAVLAELGALCRRRSVPGVAAAGGRSRPREFAACAGAVRRRSTFDTFARCCATGGRRSARSWSMATTNGAVLHEAVYLGKPIFSVPVRGVQPPRQGRRLQDNQGRAGRPAQNNLSRIAVPSRQQDDDRIPRSPRGFQGTGRQGRIRNRSKDVPWRHAERRQEVGIAAERLEVAG
jgi:hypothetical protein